MQRPDLREEREGSLLGVIAVLVFWVVAFCVATALWETDGAGAVMIAGPVSMWVVVMLAHYRSQREREQDAASD